jgi:hypothetical protein
MGKARRAAPLLIRGMAPQVARTQPVQGATGRGRQTVMELRLQAMARAARQQGTAPALPVAMAVATRQARPQAMAPRRQMSRRADTAVRLAAKRLAPQLAMAQARRAVHLAAMGPRRQHRVARAIMVLGHQMATAAHLQARTAQAHRLGAHPVATGHLRWELTRLPLQALALELRAATPWARPLRTARMAQVDTGLRRAGPGRAHRVAMAQAHLQAMGLARERGCPVRSLAPAHHRRQATEAHRCASPCNYARACRSIARDCRRTCVVTLALAWRPASRLRQGRYIV